MRTRLSMLATIAAVVLVAAACASQQDPDASVGNAPGAASTCLEGTVDCDDTPTGGVLPPALPGDAGSGGALVDGGLSVSEALAYDGDELVAVKGFIVTEGSISRLCEALAESYPPQCGGASVEITNSSALGDLVLVEEGTTQWSETSVSLLGDIDNGELTIASTASAAAPNPPTDNGVRALEVDGVWVFTYSPSGGMDALHSGSPAIVDGCLVVDDTIVVWPADQLDAASAAVAAARAGEHPELLIAGGGMSLSEGAEPSQIPAAITEHCAAEAVWFAAP